MNRRVDSDDSWLFATVTATNPLRVRLDGDATQIASTPITLVSGLAVNDRVWCQLHGLQLVIHGRTTGAGSVSGTLVRAGSATRTSSTSNTTSIFNILTVTLPQALTVTGIRFRIAATGILVGDTAGGESEFEINIGQNASVGGTKILGGHVDHRLSGRQVTLTVTGEYVYDDVEDVDNMNIVLTCDPLNGAYAYASATAPTWLTVDRVLP